MNLKLLFFINDNEKKINALINRFHLPFNTVIHGEGTASKSMLDFFGLAKTEKIVLVSIVSDYYQKNIIEYLKEKTKIEEIGKGIAFVVPLSSSSIYLQDAFKKSEGDEMKNKSDYHLIITIVNEGLADKVMNIAKKSGANGGTLIKGRGLGEKNSFKFFNMTIEPEKDIILIVCRNDNKNRIMESILEKNGVNTPSKGICFSLPIDSQVGLDE